MLPRHVFPLHAMGEIHVCPPHQVLFLFAISDRCHRSFISLNFACLLSIEAKMSTQVLMMSCIMSFHCVLWVTYLPYLVLSLCAIGDLCCHSFISLNFLGLLSIEARISTQLLMMSHVRMRL